jgi:hypothetical protein
MDKLRSPGWSRTCWVLVLTALVLALDLRPAPADDKERLRSSSKLAAANGKVFVSHRDVNDMGVITAFNYDGTHSTVVAEFPAQRTERGRGHRVGSRHASNAAAHQEQRQGSWGSCHCGDHRRTMAKLTHCVHHA